MYYIMYYIKYDTLRIHICTCQVYKYPDIFSIYYRARARVRITQEINHLK